MINRKHGFTLVELMITVVIFSAAIGVISRTFSTALSVWKRGEETIFLFQEAKKTIDLISEEIRCSFISPGNKEIKFSGIDQKLGKIDADEITFFTVKKPSFSTEWKDIGLYKISYYLIEKPDNKGYALYRKEIAGSEKLNLSGEIVQLLLSNVTGLDFQYYQDKWQEKREPSQILPSLVRISLKLKEKNGREFTFRTTANIASGR